MRTEPAHSGSGGTGGPPPPPGPEISELECRLRFARAERDRSSKPLPEYYGSNDVHDAANCAELEKPRLCGACYACLNGRVKYDLFHLDCLQHGRRATHKQRMDKAFSVPGAIPSKHF
jgi:hypothetical protein